MFCCRINKNISTNIVKIGVFTLSTAKRLTTCPSQCISHRYGASECVFLCLVYAIQQFQTHNHAETWNTYSRGTSTIRWMRFDNSSSSRSSLLVSIVERGIILDIFTLNSQVLLGLFVRLTSAILLLINHNFSASLIKTNNKESKHFFKNFSSI